METPETVTLETRRPATILRPAGRSTQALPCHPCSATIHPLPRRNSTTGKAEKRDYVLTNHFQNANLFGSMPATSPEVKDFLRRIGSKGGRKSAQHPDRKRLNRQAAESRWRKRLPTPKEI